MIFCCSAGDRASRSLVQGITLGSFGVTATDCGLSSCSAWVRTALISVFFAYTLEFSSPITDLYHIWSIHSIIICLENHSISFLV